MKRDIFDHLYQVVDHDEWLSGVELYQENLVHQIRLAGELITGVVGNTSGHSCRVSIKVQPNGRFIQWVECSCQLNRRYGRYCRHLSAILLKLGVDKNPLITTLDTSSSPFPPPSSPRGSRRLPPQPIDEKDKITSANLSGAGVFTFLQGSIHSAALVGRGPSIKLVLEDETPNQRKEHLLSTDESAALIKAHPGGIERSTALSQLRVIENAPFFLATKIYLEEGERIIAERVVAVPCSALEPQLKGETPFTAADDSSFYLLGAESSSEQPQKFAFIPYKGLENKIGKNYFFLPRIGYLSYHHGTAKSSWFELPLKKAFVGDEAGRLIERGYAEFFSAGAICLSEKLSANQKMPELELASISLEQGADSFFYLAPFYKLGDTEIPMLELIQLVRNEKRSFFQTAGRWYKIPEAITEFSWSIDQRRGKIKASALELSRFKVLTQGKNQPINQLFSRQEIATLLQADLHLPPPAYNTTTLQLRPYQQAGLTWLWWLHHQKLHGLLADDMGLGKTHQAMALISAISTQWGEGKKDEGKPRFLVVCPTTVMTHWQDKLKTFLPEMKALTYYGSDRIKLLSRFSRDYDVLITSYRLMLHDVKYLKEISWQLVILDEAHYIKNHRTSTYQAACLLPCSMRLALSGTPLENHLGELKNIFDFLVPGYLGSDEYFRKYYSIPIEHHHDSQAEQDLQTLIRPLKLRRSKATVLAELPAKIEELKYCFLSPEQIKLYRHLIQEKAAPLLKKLHQGQTPIPYLHVFAVLQLLKQICNHPASVIPNADYRKHQSGKFELFKELLAEALDCGNKVVVFSQYVKMIDIINQYCQHQGILGIAMTGSSKNRGQLIEKFQSDPECRVFISSLLTGGIGIDLTAASTVIHYDRWWNASKEDQATDRVHRIGQVNFVQIMKLVTTGTLEEKIATMISKKQKLVEKFLGSDTTISSAFTRDDLIFLLE